MGSARRLPYGLALALVLVPAIAMGQGTTPAPAPPPPPPPPPGGGGGVAPAPAGSGAAPAADAKKEKGEVGGFTFSDKPQKRTQQPSTARRVVRHAGGPLATFPGFEQLPDGGSRLFVQLSQTVPVEQRVAPGSVTYVLKGAHLRVHNDTNALVTVHFNTPVFRARLTPSGNDLLFVLELRSAATPTFKVADNIDKTSTLQIDFPKGDFLVGDGNERVPAEQPPGKGTKRSSANAGGKGAPALADSAAPNNAPSNPGPTP